MTNMRYVSNCPCLQTSTKVKDGIVMCAMHTDVHALQRNVKYLVLCGNTCTLPSEVWTGYICTAMAWERTSPSLGSSYVVTCLSVCTSFLQCVWCHKPLFADIWLQLEVQDGTMMRAWSAKKGEISGKLLHLTSFLHSIPFKVQFNNWPLTYFWSAQYQKQ